jgi:hypothetical protein
MGRKAANRSESTPELREPMPWPLAENNTKMTGIGQENRYFWEIFIIITDK